MKYLSLQQAMLGMRVVLTDTGVLLKSPAGSAEYNHKGRRIKVNGHADYFPDHLRVKDKRTPKGGYVSVGKYGTTVLRSDGTVGVQIGKLDTANAIIKNAQANYNVQMHINRNEEKDARSIGMTINNTATAWRLSDQMHEAIINAVRESDLFKSLVQSLDAQAASISGVQQAMRDAVTDAISNAVKPGGLLWRATR
ncbi:hypothetical protein [Pseudocitrobacter faecalis]|uniref:DUF1983 domain-containing protein n=1 Tax=Pseudocitrobacter faecalis TaxID=1398493 RepID=A0ABX9FXX4_9ENTR|nr:hypothetical protein DFQ50_104406 [Pseudocitrobacter faecalis]